MDFSLIPLSSWFNASEIHTWLLIPPDVRHGQYLGYIRIKPHCNRLLYQVHVHFKCTWFLTLQLIFLFHLHISTVQDLKWNFTKYYLQSMQFILLWIVWSFLHYSDMKLYSPDSIIVSQGCVKSVTSQTFFMSVISIISVMITGDIQNSAAGIASYCLVT